MTSTRSPSFLRHGAALMAVPFLLSACVAGPAPRNIPSADWMPEQSRGIAAVACRMSPGPVPSGLAAAGFRPAADLVALQVVAPGDRLRLRIAGSEDVVSGVFVVDPGGMLTLPGLPKVLAKRRCKPVSMRHWRPRRSSGDCPIPSICVSSKAPAFRWR